MEPLNASAPFSLTTVGLVVGVLIALSHLAGLLASRPAISAAKDFPAPGSGEPSSCDCGALDARDRRHDGSRGILPMRHLIVAGVAVAGILTWRFVPDFLPRARSDSYSFWPPIPCLRAPFSNTAP